MSLSFTLSSKQTFAFCDTCDVLFETEIATDFMGAWQRRTMCEDCEADFLDFCESQAYDWANDR